MKLFFEEREVNVVLCALMSGSLLFSRKKEDLLEICSLVGFSTLKMSNTLMPVIISNNKITTLPPSKKLSATEHFLLELDKISLFKKQIDLQNISTMLHPKLKKKSLIILVGDFLGDIDLSLLAHRHEVFVIIIRDKFEENPKVLGDVEFTDPETGEISELHFGKSARDSYKKKYEINDHKLYQHLRSLGISHTKIINQK